MDSWIIEISQLLKDCELLEEQLAQIHGEFGDAFSSETMQGFAFQKPHGYSGDFEILDRIYQKRISAQPHLSKWDIFWHKHSAARAVRNRVQYFHSRLKNNYKKIPDCKNYDVLNLASGPGRDILYFLDKNPKLNIFIDCIEQDKNAIEYATALCKIHLNKVNFIKMNALRLKQYDLIWSAGLFDCFNDKLFIRMLKKLKGLVSSDGEIVIDNFSTENSSKPFMGIFEWHLNHRSPQTLKELALSAGFKLEQISIKKEESGVNLFLHIKQRI